MPVDTDSTLEVARWQDFLTSPQWENLFKPALETALAEAIARMKQGSATATGEVIGLQAALELPQAQHEAALRAARAEAEEIEERETHERRRSGRIWWPGLGGRR